MNFYTYFFYVSNFFFFPLRFNIKRFTVSFIIHDVTKNCAFILFVTLSVTYGRLIFKIKNNIFIRSCKVFLTLKKFS